MGTLELAPIGVTEGVCTTFNLKNNDSWVKSLEVGYDVDNGVTYVGILGSNNEIRVFGDKTIDERTGDKFSDRKWKFTETNQLIGFYGTNRVGIESLGVLIFNTDCMDEGEISETDSEKNEDDDAISESGSEKTEID